MTDDYVNDLIRCFEELRLRQSTFRGVDPQQLGELESMRLQILQAAASASPNGPLVWGMKLRLMERAFYVLQLQRYANAPENHGWMNLFRQWTLDRDQAQQAPSPGETETLSPDFRSFFQYYVRACREPMDKQPIPHPWLKTPDQPGPGVFMDSGHTEPAMGIRPTRPGAGGVFDPKGDADQRYKEPPHHEPGGSSAPNE